jgi:thiol:disulfide interchange protein DsbD
MIAFALAATTAAAPVRTEHVEAELVAAKSAIVLRRAITIALRLGIEKGWHTYWRNPGDSGLPTTLAWTLPAGVEAGAIEWPAPRALPAGPLVNYGYENEVLHLVELKPARTLAHGGIVTLNARADWLVCRRRASPKAPISR